MSKIGSRRVQRPLKRRIDPLSPTQRSERMSRVKGRNTAPERKICSLLDTMRYCYRLHQRDLPGSPDIVFPYRRKVIFVHGCFWHRHHCPNGKRTPRSRLSFWVPKLESNQQRDRRKMRELIKLGWNILVIWECQLKDESKLKDRIKGFLRKKK